ATARHLDSAECMSFTSLCCAEGCDRMPRVKRLLHILAALCSAHFIASYGAYSLYLLYLRLAVSGVPLDAGAVVNFLVAPLGVLVGFYHEFEYLTGSRATAVPQILHWFIF